MPSNHEIDYTIIGEEMQCVEIELDPQETVGQIRYRVNNYFAVSNLFLFRYSLNC